MLLKNKQDSNRLQLKPKPKLSALLPRKLLPPPQKQNALPLNKKGRLASSLKKSSIMPTTDLQDSLQTSSRMTMPTIDQPASFVQRSSSHSNLTLLASIFQNTRTSSTDQPGSEEPKLRRLNHPPIPTRIASTDRPASEDLIPLLKSQEPRPQKRSRQALAPIRDLLDSRLSLPRLP